MIENSLLSDEDRSDVSLQDDEHDCDVLPVMDWIAETSVGALQSTISITSMRSRSAAVYGVE